MSEVSQSADEFLDESADAVEAAGDAAADQIGLSSDETANKKESLLASMTIYDGMLLVALLCATLATLFLFLELREFGNFPFSFPWRTKGF